MKEIKDTEFGGERPLFGSRDLRLTRVTVHAGESALKNCRNIEATDCRFEGKYPFWHVDGFRISHCVFTEGARAALWYSRDLEMTDTEVLAPKMFREMEGVSLRSVRIPDAQETLWYCRDVRLDDVEVDHADYLLMHSADIDISHYRHRGNYAFQYCRNMTIRQADIQSKDAFWATENVTVYDSTLSGEYLGWHSHGLRLVRCHISGTQPLCYASNLILDHCTFDADADLAFEESTLEATIVSPMTSIKNPTSGHVSVPRCGLVILDHFRKAPADCTVIQTEF